MASPSVLQLPLALKVRGQAKARDAESEASRTALDNAIACLALRGAAFTAETVRDLLHEQGIAGPAHANAIGAAFTQAARAGVIRSCGFRLATRPERRASAIREWVGA